MLEKPFRTGGIEPSLGSGDDFPKGNHRPAGGGADGQGQERQDQLVVLDEPAEPHQNAAGCHTGSKHINPLA